MHADTARKRKGKGGLRQISNTTNANTSPCLTPTFLTLQSWGILDELSELRSKERSNANNSMTNIEPSIMCLCNKKYLMVVAHSDHNGIKRISLRFAIALFLHISNWYCYEILPVDCFILSLIDQNMYFVGRQEYQHLSFVLSRVSKLMKPYKKTHHIDIVDTQGPDMPFS